MILFSNLSNFDTRASTNLLKTGRWSQDELLHHPRPRPQHPLHPRAVPAEEQPPGQDQLAPCHDQARRLYQGAWNSEEL